jgi:ribonuclease J
VSVQANKLEIIALGGLGEFGLNSLIVRSGEDMILIDAGMMFPDESLPGVDIVIPDLAFVQEHAAQLKAIIVTHAHEDHIGALPYLLRVVQAPVYGTRFTLAVADHKLAEHGLLQETEVHPVEPGERAAVPPYDIEFIRSTHSTIDSLALAISTPGGTIVHATDFKIDDTPVIGQPMDVDRLRQLGDRGVLAALVDSTNAERPGRTPSEKAVIPALEEIFETAPGRIIISCFASSIHRIQIILDLAYEYGCKVALAGRTMVRMIETAMDGQYLDVPPNLLVPLPTVNQWPRDKVVMLVTGCQGEPMAALARMATESYKQIRIEPNDTVVLSARVIPGNEKAIARLIDHIYRRGGRVIDESVSPVHVSGHPAQGDLKIFLDAVRPRYLIPIHGDYRRLCRHREYAVSLGFDAQRVIVAENGNVIELDENEARLAQERVFVGRTLIDEAGFEAIEDFIIRDRRHLAEDGFVLPIVAINEVTGELEDVPEIITRGFVGVNDSADLLDQARQVVIRTVEESTQDERTDWAVMKEKIRIELKRFITKRTDRYPLIIPVIIEI